MFNFFNNVEPIIVDAIFISVIVLIAFIGVIKGFKKTLIGLFIFVVSLFLSFSPWMNEVKVLLIDKILFVNKWLPAGSDCVTVFVVNMLLPFISSFALFVLFYVVLTVLRMAISIITKSKARDIRKKSIVGRIFSGLISLVFGGVFFISVILICNNNLIGMKSMIDQSKITGFVIHKTEDVLNKKDEDLTKKIVLKIYKGDLQGEIEGDTVLAFEHVDENANKFFNDEYKKKLEDKSLSNDQTKIIIKEQLLMLYNLSILSKDFDDFSEKITDKFFKMSEQLIVVMNKKCLDVNLSGLDITVSDYGKMKVAFAEAGLDEKLLMCLDEIVLY